jgi:hypothetical protein
MGSNVEACLILACAVECDGLFAQIDDFLVLVRNGLAELRSITKTVH